MQTATDSGFNPETGNEAAVSITRPVATFTNGPWRPSSDGLDVMAGQRGTETAVCIASAYRKEDARLIAVAPDLYAALKALLEACELHANRSGGDFGPEIGPAAEVAEVALAKVEASQ